MLHLNKIRNIPTEIKASASFLTASVISAAIGYLTTPIYTKLLNPTEFGISSVFLTWKQVLGIIAMFCLSYGVFNNGMHDYPNKRNEFSFSMLVLSNLITVIFAIIFFILFPYVKKIIEIDLKYLVVMFVGFLVAPAYNFWIVRQRYELKYKMSLIWSIVIAFIPPFVTIFLMNSSSINRLDSRILGTEVPLVIVYALFYIYLAKRSNFKCDISYWKSALLFNLPLIPHYLSSYVLGSSDKIMISKLIGSGATAYYSVSYSVASVAMIVWSAANASIVPFTYKKCGEKCFKDIEKITTPVIILFALVCFLIIIFAPEIVYLMATSEYQSGIYVIPPVVAGLFFQVTYYLYANILYYYKKPKFVMYSSLGSAILNILLNYIFIKRFGYVAAGYTTLICYMLQSYFDFFAMKRVVQHEIYNMKVINTIAIVLIFFVPLSCIIYRFFIARLIILIVLFLICLINFKFILDTIKILIGKK